MNGKRIELIDGLRGLAVCLMVLHHLMYDLVEFLGAPAWLFSCPPIDFLHYVFAGLFILLAGVSSNFSHSNIKRGLKTLAVAALITLVTCLMNMDIIWGVLHLLGFCMLFYGLTHKLWERIPRTLMPILCVSLLLAGLLVISKIPVDASAGYAKILWFFGWNPGLIFSNDYFPLLPWLFVFLLGTWVGGYIKEGRFPKWFYEVRVPFFPAVGRQALLIYVLHQPLIYGMVLAIKYLFF